MAGQVLSDQDLWGQPQAPVSHPLPGQAGVAPPVVPVQVQALSPPSGSQQEGINAPNVASRPMSDQEAFGDQSQAASPVQWGTVTGQSATPVSYDRFGNGIDAQGNILSRPQSAPQVTPVQQAYAAAHPSPATLQAAPGIVQSGMNSVGSGLRSFADTISGGFANKGQALLDAASNPQYGGSLGERFSAALDDQTGQSQTLQRSHPFASGVGSVMGTAGQGLAVPAKAPIIGGALLGGLDSAGNARGGPLSQATQTASGALTGGLLGGAGRWAEGAPIGVARPTSLLPVPEVSPRAASYIGSLLGSPDPAMVAAHAAGKPVTTAEMLGPSGRNALATTARRAGSTGTQMEADMLSRVTAAPQTILDDFTAASGVSPHIAQGDIDTYVANGRKEAAPLYDAAYAQPAPYTPQLQAILQRPSMTAALKNAVATAKEEGRNPNELGFAVAKDGTVSVSRPTMQTLDYVKRGVDDVLQGYKDKTTGRLNLDNQGRAIQGTRNAFMDIVTSPDTPGGRAYAAALAKSGDYLSASDAFEAGKKLVFNPKITTAQMQTQFARMTPAQQEAFRGGIGNSMFNDAQNGKLDPRLFRTPAVRAKLAAAIGQDQADQFLQSVSHVQKMDANARQIAPQINTQTAPITAEAARQDAPPGGLKGILAPVPGELVTGATVGLLHGLHGAVTGGAGLAGLGVARRSAALATHAIGEAGMPISVRNEVGGILGGHGGDAFTPEQLRTLLESQQRRGLLPSPSAVQGLGLLTAPATSAVLQNRRQ